MALYNLPPGSFRASDLQSLTQLLFITGDIYTVRLPHLEITDEVISGTRSGLDRVLDLVLQTGLDRVLDLVLQKGSDQVLDLGKL